ncbi:MipA/OmpV family protein [Polycladidibacter stylochi]|uniref:MipA/OmpV family protein n=1 Tax=Polycladidibacter stylochi TaxID=1807766 RepID=UPI00082D5057|nr:MipA/OmpV family protein [Pseudovibrio stylochi]
MINIKSIYPITLIVLWVSPASFSYADDFSIMQPLTKEQKQFQYVIDLGLGALGKKKYPGANQTAIQPFLLGTFGRYYIPYLGQVREDRSDGLYFFPVFGSEGARKADDIPRLEGLRSIDWAGELGLGVGYNWLGWNVFGQFKKGAVGHYGTVFRIGGDYTYWLNEHLALRVGPRADFYNNEYIDTYFSVSDEEASRGSLTSFNADAGLGSYGLSASASYALSEHYTLQLQAEWKRFANDAAKSPVVVSRDTVYVSTGVSYRFSFDFFN